MEPTTLSRPPRVVPVGRTLSWFGDAIRWWKRGPLVFSVMAATVLAVSILLGPVPIASLLATNVVAPLLSCGFLYASLAADRGERPRIAHLFAVFTAPLRAQATVVAAALVVTLAEAAVGWLAADVNLLMPLPDSMELSPGAVVTIYAVDILASLPLTFVPMAALFDGERMPQAFASSLRAFALNTGALLGLGAYAFVLVLLGLATTGVGLVLGLPWIAAASYAAWKDIYGVAGEGDADR